MTTSMPSSRLLARIETSEITEDIASEALPRIHASLVPSDIVGQAILPLLTRVAYSWTSVHALTTHPDTRVRERCKQDVGALFRIMFEAYVQLAFILHDPSKRVERASLYVDFEAVEKMRGVARIYKYDTATSRAVKDSPMRPVGEANLHAQFAGVADRFLRAPGKKTGKMISIADVRDYWYEGTLRSLARELGIEARLDQWIRLFDPSIHSSISGCKHGCIMGIEHTSYWASQIALHCLKLGMDYAGVRLDEALQDWIDETTNTPLGSFDGFVRPHG